MTQTHKLVPIEPTEEMLIASEKAAFDAYNDGDNEREIQKRAYKAMLASAPEVGGAVACAICGHQTTYCSDCGVEVWKPTPDRTAQLEQQLGDMEKLYNETMLERDIAALYSHNLEADNKRLVEALTSTNGFLDTSSCFQLQQLNSNAALLTEMEAKG